MSAIQEALEKVRKERERVSLGDRTPAFLERLQPTREKFRFTMLAAIFLGMVCWFLFNNLDGFTPRVEQWKDRDGRWKSIQREVTREAKVVQQLPMSNTLTAYGKEGKERLERAKSMIKEGDMVGAERELLTLLNGGFRTKEVTSLLARLYVNELQKPYLAVELYRQALEEAPGDPSLMVNLGVAYLKAGRLEKAEEAFEEALRSGPHLVEAHYNMACLKALKGDLEEARRSLGKAVEIDKEALKWAKTDPDLAPLWRKTHSP